MHKKEKETKEKPPRVPICGVISSHMLGQVVACGKLVSGAIRSDSKVIVMPAGELATVRIIEWGSSRLNIAGAGDQPYPCHVRWSSLASRLHSVHVLLPGAEYLGCRYCCTKYQYCLVLRLVSRRGQCIASQALVPSVVRETCRIRLTYLTHCCGTQNWEFELHIHHAWAWSGTQDSVAAGPEDWPTARQAAVVEVHRGVFLPSQGCTNRCY